jgi:hypothetical protein
MHKFHSIAKVVLVPARHSERSEESVAGTASLTANRHSERSEESMAGSESLTIDRHSERSEESPFPAI